MSRTVICRLDLGYTRISGFTLYDGSSKEFQEKTPKEVKELIKKGQVNGLKLVNGEIELDKEGFNQQNLMIKTGVGKYRQLHEKDTLINCMYAVVKVIKNDKETVYEVINNRYARVKIIEDKLKVLYDIGGFIAGVIIEKNKIKICNGVEVEDNRTLKLEKSKKETNNIEKKYNNINKDKETESSPKADNLKIEAESKNRGSMIRNLF